MQEDITTQTEETAAEDYTEFESAFDSETEDAAEETQAEEDFEVNEELFDVKEPDELEAEADSILMDGDTGDADGTSENGSVLDQLAKNAGMPMEHFLRTAESLLDGDFQEQASVKVTERTEMLLEQGLPYDIAQHMAEVEVENAQLRDSAGLRSAVRRQEQEIEQTCQRDIDRLFQNYPGLKGETVPDQVIKDIEQGMTPMEAYQKNEVEEMNRELSALRMYRRNRETTAGSVKGGAQDKQDEFSEAFWKVLNE